METLGRLRKPKLDTRSWYQLLKHTSIDSSQGHNATFQGSHHRCDACLKDIEIVFSIVHLSVFYGKFSAESDFQSSVALFHCKDSSDLYCFLALFVSVEKFFCETFLPMGLVIPNPVVLVCQAVARESNLKRSQPHCAGSITQFVVLFHYHHTVFILVSLVSSF